MIYAVCLLSVIPVRAEASHRSEQVTQLLFGDLVTVLDKKEKWYLVQVQSDSYQGWIAEGQLTPLSKNEYDALTESTRSVYVTTDLIQVVKNTDNNAGFLISAGSSLYNCQGNRFTIAGNSFEYMGEIREIKGYEPSSLLKNAMVFLHSSYMWGGKSALGIDCSGLTQLAFKMAGKHIHRDASQQATQGEMIDLIHEAQAGDLLFFDNDNGDIIHTGIMMEDMHIIHAHQKVRIDKVDHLGIFNSDTKKYSHKLRLIKRII
jgi:gamma-D-glutamyl-L-lysine dipeptidyl-peptidase